MGHIIIVGIILFLFGLYLAFFAHSTIWYTFFTIGGFLLFEGLNVSNGFSVLRKKTRFVLVWFAFILIAVAGELVCNTWLNLWDYPSFNEMEFFFHALIIGYPFTGFFGLGVFVFLEGLFPERRAKWIVLPVSAFLLGYLVEYPNVFAYEWKYINWPLGEFLGIPILASLLWILLLFALLFKKPFQVDFWED